MKIGIRVWLRFIEVIVSFPLTGLIFVVLFSTDSMRLTVRSW